MRYFGNYHYFFNPFMFGGVGMFILLLVIGLIVFFIVFNKKNNNATSASALQILQERFAKGEINQEQFLSMKKALEN